MSILRLKDFFSTRKDPFYHQIKSLLKFSPKSLEYYKRAFIHRSLNRRDINGIAINYERLEFLGDSILSSIISSYLFKNIPVNKVLKHNKNDFLKMYNQFFKIHLIHLVL